MWTTISVQTGCSVQLVHLVRSHGQYSFHIFVFMSSLPNLFNVRLVRVCLGHSAVAERKLEVAMPLTILGIQVAISELGVRFTLNDSKRVEWQKQLVAALDDAKLCPGM